MATATYSKAHPELFRVVDHCLHSQHGSLVVHLDPVELHPMLHPKARHPRAWNLHFALVGPHLALEVAGQLAAEEAHHVAGAEVDRAVLAQPGHQLLDGSARSLCANMAETPPVVLIKQQDRA